MRCVDVAGSAALDVAGCSTRDFREATRGRNIVTHNAFFRSYLIWSHQILTGSGCRVCTPARARREPANCRGKSSQPRPAMAVVPSEPSPNEARAACDGLRVMAARLGAQVWALRGTSGARVHCRPPTRRTFEAQNAAARRVLESCAPCAHLRAVVANRPPPALRKLHLRGQSGHRRQLRISEHPTSGHPHKEASGCCGAAVSSSCA